MANRSFTSLASVDPEQPLAGRRRYGWWALSVALVGLLTVAACTNRAEQSAATQGAVVLDPDANPRRQGLPDPIALGERLPEFEHAFRSPDGRFSLRFPTKPRLDRQLLETPNGTIELVTIACDYSVVKAYWASYSEYPSSYISTRAPDEILDEARETVVRKLGERTIFTVLADTTRQGQPAQRFRARDGHFHAEYELVLAGNRLYQLGVLRDGAYPPKVDVEAFLAGFRLWPASNG